MTGIWLVKRLDRRAARGGRVALELVGWLLRQRQRYRVTGDSMRPTLLPNDHLLVDGYAYVMDSPRVGDIVVAKRSVAEPLVLTKRVAGCEGDHVWLASDNPTAGTDSRHFGPVSLELILGRVTARFGASGWSLFEPAWKTSMCRRA